MIDAGGYRLFLIITIIFCVLAPNPINAGCGTIKSEESPDWCTLECIDINDAFVIALANNPSIAIFVSKLNQARQKTLRARSSYWPSIDLESRFITSGELDVNNEEVPDIYKLDLRSHWIFFNGFKCKFENIISEYGEQIAIAALADARRLLLLAVSRAFYEAQISREKINIAITDETFNERQLNEAEAKYKAGSASLSETLNFKIRLNNARMTRANEEGNYRIAMSNLISLLGIPYLDFASTSVLAPFSPETNEELMSLAWDNLVDVAIEQRPDIKIRELFVKKTDANISINKANIYPKIFISTSVSAQGTNDMRFSDDDVSYIIGVGLSCNLFAGGLHTASIREAVEQKIESKNELQECLNSVKAEIRNSVLRVVKSQTRVVSQRKNTELIEQTRDLVEKEYNADHGSLVRLNEIQNNLIKARSQLVVSIANLRQAWIELKAAIGEQIY